MKLKLVKKNQIFLRSDDLYSSKKIASFNGEDYYMTLDEFSNFTMTVFSKPYFIKQFDIGMFLRNSIAITEFVSTGDISPLKKQDEYLSRLSPFAKELVNTLNVNFVGVVEDIMNVCLLLANVKDLHDTDDSLITSYANLYVAKFYKKQEGLVFLGLENVALEKGVATKIIDYLD